MPIKTITAALLAIALLSSAGAQGSRDLRDGHAPPPPLTQTLSVVRGDRLTIPLGIAGSRGEPLEFFIRTQPAHGKLSALTRTGLNTATVLYTPAPGNTAADDRFTYSVRGSEGVSAPAAVTIRFTERVVIPAKLKAPFDLEFPAVFPGQRSTVEMEVENEGGSILEGEVTVPAPWSIDGVKIFRLGAGQRATFRLVITPAEAGVKTGDAVISGTQRKVIPLRSVAEIRLAATPALLRLAAQPGSQTRTGVLKIENRSDEETEVAIETGARLLADHTVRVPAKGSATVPVFADAATPGMFDDTVKLSSKEWKAGVPVHVVAVGAILKFSGEAVSITGSAPVTGLAVLENSGGEAVTVRLDIGRPFEIEKRVVAAPPRGSVEIPIVIRDPAPGTFHATLQATGEGGSASVPVSAEISEPRAAKTGARNPAMPGEKAREGAPAAEAAQAGPPLIFPTAAREIPNAFGKFARNVEMYSATLDWPVKLGEGNRARAEQRVLSLSEDGKLQIGWSPLEKVTITRAAGRVMADIRGLEAGTYYVVRIVAGQGSDSTVLLTSDFRTVPKKPLYTGSLRTPFLALTLCALAYAIWRSRRTPVTAKPKGGEQQSEARRF